MDKLQMRWRQAGAAATLCAALSAGAASATPAPRSAELLNFGAVGRTLEVSQSFNPPSRSAPARTADGGTRRFNPQSRSAPERTADGGTRRFNPQSRSAPERTADGGTRQFTPQSRSAPERTADGGTRGCFQPITALDPEPAMPLTVSERPTFFWHVPAGAAPQLRFVLVDAADETEVLYESYMETPSEDSIVSLTLPAASNKALEVGKTYHWYLVAVCDTSNRRDGIAIDGWVERVELSEPLAEALKTRGDRAKPALFAEAGIWHEALSHFVTQRQLHPQDADLAQQWQLFLESVNLEAYADAPVVPWLPLN